MWLWRRDHRERGQGWRSRGYVVVEKGPQACSAAWFLENPPDLSSYKAKGLELTFGILPFRKGKITG
jgi:hypothetical protein